MTSLLRACLGMMLMLALLLACKPGRTLGEGPPAIDRRTKVLAAFDPASMIGSHGGGLDLGSVARAQLPAPRIVDHGPVGDAPVYADPELRFSRPMFPLGSGGPTDPGMFTIDPPIAGEVYWSGPERVVFYTTEPLPPATTFTVRFAAKLPIGDPAAVELEHRWQFTTTRPNVTLWPSESGQHRVGSHGSYHHRTKIAVRPSQPLARETLAKHVRAEAFDAEGRSTSIAVEVREVSDRNESAALEILPRDRWPADREIVVTVDAGLTGELGPATMGHDVARSFRTVAGVFVDKLVCVERDYADGCELGPVALRLSSPIHEDQARHVRIRPEPRGFGVVTVDEHPGARGAFENLLVWGDFQRDVDYVISVDPALRDIHGQALAGKRELELRFVEPAPSLTIDGFDRTLDLAGPATIGVESRHLEQLGVTLAVLSEAEHERLLDHDFAEHGFPTDLGEIHRQRIHVAHSGQFGWSSHALDLSRFTQGKPGVVAFELSASALTKHAQGRSPPHDRHGLVQLTRLGVAVVGSVPGGLVRVARLADDTPVAGASVELIEAPNGKRRVLGKTDAAGRLPLPSSADFGKRALLRVRDGDDQVLVEIGELSELTHHQPSPTLRPWETVRIALTSERQLYLPGERVHVIGWAAIESPYELSGLRPLPDQTKVALRIYDSHSKLVAERTVTAKRHGKFWATLELPKHGALGRHRIRAIMLGGDEFHDFEVKDIQPPEFVLAAIPSSTDLGPGDAPRIGLAGTYLFGGPVPIEQAWHSTRCWASNYRPPGLDRGFEVSSQESERHDLFTSDEAVATSDGRVGYTLEPAPLVAGPLRCTHDVTATDAGLRTASASIGFWVHPPAYLAVRSPASHDPDGGATIEIRALRPDGSPVTELERVELTVQRSAWDLADGEDPSPQRCRPRLVEGRGQCRLRALASGSHWLEARARIGELELNVRDWFALYEPDPDDSRTPGHDLTIRTEGGPHRVGERAKFVVEAPWSKGRALVLFGKGGVHQIHELEIDHGRAELELEIDDAWIPEVEAQVIAIEPGWFHAQGTGLSIPPRFHESQTSLAIGSESRELTVSQRAPSEATIRESIAIDVDVRDAAGRPVRGHVAIWAVDEAILALAPLRLPSITQIFARRDRSLQGIDIAHRYGGLLAPHQPRPDPYTPRAFDPNWMAAPEGLGRWLIGTGRGGGGATGEIGYGSSIRHKFSSAPIFIADAQLDANGHARVIGTLPDNLTTFRIVAIASAPLPSVARFEGRSGSAEARIRVTRPLVVRATVPRILRPGDRAEIGVVVDNLAGPDGMLELDVSLQGGHQIASLGGDPHTRVSLAAGAQIRVTLPIAAAAAGELVLEVQARLVGQGSLATVIRDGLRVPVTIEPEPGAIERAAIYGSLTSDDHVALLPIAIPSNVDPHHGGLSVSFGASLLGGLEDAVAYLIDYPHGGAEQTASRILPVVLLAEPGEEQPRVPLGVADPREHVEAGLARLLTMQDHKGGFKPWPGARESSANTSAYVALVLARARRAGHELPAEMLPKLREYLEARITRWLLSRGPALEQDIRAALLLRALAEVGDASATALTVLYDRRARLPLFARVNLLLAILADDHTEQRASRIDALLAELFAYVEETQATARVVSHAPPWVEYWDSDLRTSALLLSALVRARHWHPLIPKLARGLLDARERGRWANTQENAYALMALLDYAAAHEMTSEFFEGRVWMGNSVLTRLDGRASGFSHEFVPMAELIAGAPSTDPALILERAGNGRLYYRIGLDWATTEVDRPAVAAGFSLRRQLRGTDGVIGDEQSAAVGNLLALDLEIEAKHALDDLAIEVPIVGGFEPIMFDLSRTAQSMLGGRRGGWVTHQELHRDRVVLLVDHLEPGLYTTTVFLRVTIAGDYRMPAAQAEMIYYPEIHARTTARRVVVR